MTYLDTPQPAQPRLGPQLLWGAASPLWGYFGAATAGGVAFWWMTRWARPANLEALLHQAPALEASVETAVETIEDAVADFQAPEALIAEAGVEEARHEWAELASSAAETAPQDLSAAQAPEPTIEETPPAPIALEAAPDLAAPAIDLDVPAPEATVADASPPPPAEVVQPAPDAPSAPVSRPRTRKSGPPTDA